jgi:hypothetical protein
VLYIAHVSWRSLPETIGIQALNRISQTGRAGMQIIRTEAPAGRGGLDIPHVILLYSN